jgi:hypothetical protein
VTPPRPGPVPVANLTVMAGMLRAAGSALGRRPDLWPIAVVEARAFVPRRWWRRWPPSPLPPAAYLQFRLQTMYGDGAAVPAAADLVGYLEWCRRMRRIAS